MNFGHSRSLWETQASSSSAQYPLPRRDSAHVVWLHPVLWGFLAFQAQKGHSVPFRSVLFLVTYNHSPGSCRMLSVSVYCPCEKCLP